MKYDREEKVDGDVRRNWTVQKDSDKQKAERISQIPQFVPRGQFYKSVQLCQLGICIYHLLIILEILLTRTTFLERRVLLCYILPSIYTLFNIFKHTCFYRQKRVWEASQMDENKDVEKSAVMAEKC